VWPSLLMLTAEATAVKGTSDQRCLERALLAVWVEFMQQLSLGKKGRKKAVKKFATREGLWMLGLLTATLIAMLILFLSGILRVDVD
jgi:hypothetical protein